MNFAVLEPPAKVFSKKFERTIPSYDRFLAFRECFLCEMVTSYQSVKVFPSKISRYTVFHSSVATEEPLYSGHPWDSLKYPD